MERVQKPENIPFIVCYLPRHAVDNKIKMFLYASAIFITGVSLNDILMVGRNIQQVLLFQLC